SQRICPLQARWMVAPSVSASSHLLVGRVDQDTSRSRLVATRPPAVTITGSTLGLGEFAVPSVVRACPRWSPAALLPRSVNMLCQHSAGLRSFHTLRLAFVFRG